MRRCVLHPWLRTKRIRICIATRNIHRLFETLKRTWLLVRVHTSRHSFRFLGHRPLIMTWRKSTILATIISTLAMLIMISTTRLLMITLPTHIPRLLRMTGWPIHRNASLTCRCWLAATIPIIMVSAITILILRSILLMGRWSRVSKCTRITLLAILSNLPPC